MLIEQKIDLHFQQMILSQSDINQNQSSVGIGTFATDLFISKEPDSPDACVTIFDTGGQDPEAHHTYDYPTVQVKIRGDKQGYAAAFAKAQEVKEALHGLTNETWNSTRYIQIMCEGDIIFVGYDGKQRPELTINFLIHRTE